MARALADAHAATTARPGLGFLDYSWARPSRGLAPLGLLATAAARLAFAPSGSKVPPGRREHAMTALPEVVAEFLRGKRIAVAGVSRDRRQAANAIYRKLRDSGYEAIPINPNTTQAEGTECFPDLGSVPGLVDGLVIAAHPRVAPALVRQCSEVGVGRVWFHRSFGQGSVSGEAIRECEARGIQCIVGGCPLMYCEPVDVAHRCMRWWLRWRGRVPR